MTEQNNSFTCHICAGEFIKAWTDEESDQEFQENYPGEDNTNAVLLCDRCHYLARALLLYPTDREESDRLMFQAFHHPITEDEREIVKFSQQ